MIAGVIQHILPYLSGVPHLHANRSQVNLTSFALRYLIVSVLDDNQEENLFKTNCRVAMLLHTSTDATIKAESGLQTTISQAAATKKVHR